VISREAVFWPLEGWKVTVMVQGMVTPAIEEAGGGAVVHVLVWVKEPASVPLIETALMTRSETPVFFTVTSFLGGDATFTAT
jgi:hypothetical protein